MSTPTSLKSLFNLFPKDKYYNLYYSLGKYRNGVPLKKMQVNYEENLHWNEVYWKYMTSYDFVLDIDSDTHENINYAHEDTVLVHEFLNTLSIPHEVRFSGKGFHLVIPHKYFSPENLSFNPMDTDKQPYTDLYYRLSERFSDTFTEFVDTSIYDFRRVLKIPYTLACYEDPEMYVCWSFRSTQELKNFKLENYRLTLDNVHKFAQNIKGRGTFLFNKKGNVDPLIQWLKE